MVLSVAYLKLDERISLRKLLMINMGFLLATLVGFRVALVTTTARWLFLVLPIWHGVSDMLVLIASGVTIQAPEG